MADFETRVDKLETKVTTLEQQVNSVLTKLDMFIAESRAARERQDSDIRELRQKQDADIREMRQRQEVAQAKHDADIRVALEKHDTDMREMRQSIDGMGKHVRNMSIVTIIGIAAMVVAVFLK